MSPDKWSAAAMFQATRMFASNMSEGSNNTHGRTSPETYAQINLRFGPAIL